MSHVGTEDQQPSRPDAVCAEPEVVHYPAGRDHCGRVQPERLVDHPVEIGQRGKIVGAGWSITTHAADFLGRSVPGARYSQQRVGRPGQRAAGGLVARGDQGNDRISNFIVAQRITSVTAPIDQHAQHMVVGTGRTASFGDLGVDEVVDAGAGGHRPPPCRRLGPPLHVHDLR